MKTIFKLLPVVLAIAILPNAHASDNQKIAFVKQIYQNSISTQGENDNTFIYRKATPAFKEALQVQLEGYVCGEISGAILWNSQDPDFNAQITYRTNSWGGVVATLKQKRNGRWHTSDVTFALKQAGNGYQIHDIANDETASVKNSLLSCS